MRIQGSKGIPCRPFTLLDALILVSAAAVGFAGCRADDASWYIQWYHRVPSFVRLVLMLASWLVLIFRLRRPRPSIRLIARQPGAVACFGVVVLQLVQFVTTLADRWATVEMDYLSEADSAIWYFFRNFTTPEAALVPISWALLLANRRWRPEPGWIDRSGRFLGWAWIVWMVAWPILERLPI